MGILDFIFPKTCVNCKKLGSYLCANCFAYLSFDTREICAVCNRPAISGLTHPKCLKRYIIDGVFSSICYKGVVKKLIYKFKYNPYLAGLQNLLIDLFFEGLIQKEELNKLLVSQPTGGPILVPIPLHSAKFKQRGYNQAEILAKGLAEKLGLEVGNLLKRVKQTPTQVGLKREKRLANLRGAFILNTKYSPRGEAGKIHDTVLLVDDVFTTGATLLEAAKILKRNGVKKVWGITLAS